MVRDYSQFLGETPVPQVALTPLERLGWQPHFAQQVDADGLTETPPARVTQVHRNRLHVVGDGIDTLIPSGLDATVGDWVLLDADHAQGTEVLDRKSLFERRAAGHDRRLQSIAANVDTVFIVSSCNRDFNIARLERYVVLAMEAQVTPVILLTKADLCDDPAEFAQQAETISDRVAVVVLNALSTDPTEKLAPWVKPKQTVAFLGSSGVGKSTLVNALFNQTKAETAAIRENDAKGRHTTTSRQLHFTPDGCAILDTPGMRELQLADVGDGIADLFSDITDLAATCKFRDCAHVSEPGCAVQAAVDAGTLDPARLARWDKLAKEEAFNTASLAQRRGNDKAFGKLIKGIQKAKKK